MTKYHPPIQLASFQLYGPSRELTQQNCHGRQWVHHHRMHVAIKGKSFCCMMFLLVNLSIFNDKTYCQIKHKMCNE